MPSLGELTIDVLPRLSEADVAREMQRVESRLKDKIMVPLGLDTSALEQGSKRIRSEVEATSKAAVQASREQATAAREAAQAGREMGAVLREQIGAVQAVTAQLRMQVELQGRLNAGGGTSAQVAGLNRLTTAANELSNKLDALSGRQRVVVQEVQRVDSAATTAARGIGILNAQYERGATDGATWARNTGTLMNVLKQGAQEAGVFSREAALLEQNLLKVSRIQIKPPLTPDERMDRAYWQAVTEDGKRAAQQVAAVWKTEMDRAKLAVKGANNIRLDWQTGQVDDARTLERLEQMRRGYQQTQQAIQGQIEQLKGLGVLDEQQTRRVAVLTQQYEKYGQALRNLGSIEASVMGTIQKGSLADSMGRALTEAERVKQAAAGATDAVRLLEAQERAGIVTKGELSQALLREVTALKESVAATQTRAASLRNLGVLDMEQTAELQALTRAEITYTEALGRTIAAQEAAARSSNLLRAGMVAAGGSNRLNNGAMALSFLSPTAGMLAMSGGAAPYVAVGLAVAQTGKLLSEAADKVTDFRAQLQQVKGVSGESAEAINRYGSYVQKLSTQLPITTEQLIEMGRQAVMVGLHTEEGMTTYTRVMANLSMVLRDVNGNAADMEHTGQEIVKFLRSVDSKDLNADLERTGDVLVTLKTRYGVLIPEVIQLSTYWSSSAHAAGLTQEQILGISAALVGVGARAQSAGSSLTKILDTAITASAEGGQKAEAWARSLGLTVDQFDNLIRTRPAEFIQRFADRMAEAHANGTPFVKFLGDLGLKGNQLERVAAELATAHENLGRAITTAADGARDNGAAQRAAAEATANYRDRAKELHNAWDRILTTLGGPVAELFTKWTTGLLPVVTALGDLVEKLNQVKSPGDLRAALKITPEDGFTLSAIKVMAGGVAGVKEGLDRMNQGGQTQWDDLVHKMSSAKLQEDLIHAGILQSQRLPWDTLSQYKDVAAHRQHYEELLIAWYKQQAARLEQTATGVTPQGSPILRGEGPLLPGQMRQGATEAGNVTADLFIKSMTKSVVGDPRINAWCADVVSKMLTRLGYEVKSSVNAAQLERNVKAAGGQVIPLGQARAGDVVFYHGIDPSTGQRYGASSGTHVEMGAGWKNGKFMLVGSNTTPGMTSKALYDPKQAVVYRLPGGNLYGDNGLAAAGQGAGTPADPNARLKETLAEGRHLIAQYRAALQSGNDVWQAKAKAALDAFKKEHKDALGGLRTDFAALAKLESGKKVKASGYGQGYDNLNRQLGEADSLHRLNDDAQAYIKSLDGIAAAAQKAAKAEADKNGHTAKYDALLKLAGDAASKARQQRESLTREETAATREAQQRADQRRELERRLNADLAAGNLESAKANAARLRQNLDTELAAHKANAAQRLKVEQDLAPGILAAQKRVYELERKQAEDAAHATANKQRAELTAKYGQGKEPADLLKKIAATETAAVTNAGKTFDTQLSALYSASTERINNATAAVQAKNKQAADQRLRTEEEVTKQLAGMNEAQRQAQVQAAEDELTRLKNGRQARLEGAKGNQAAILQIETETAGAIQAQEERAALTRLVAAKRKAEEEKKARLDAIPKGATKAQRDALEAAADTEYLGKLSTAYRAYSLTVSKSQTDATQTVRQATEQQADKLRSLRDEYSRLADGMRDKIATGKVEQSDLTAYLKTMDELEGKAKKAGLSTDQHIQGARASAEALYQQGIDAQIAAGAFDTLADSHDRAAKASRGYTVTLEDALGQLPTGASATEAYVRALEDLAAQGRVSKEVLDAVYQAIADRTVKWQLEADAIQRVTREGLDNAQALADLGDAEGAISSLYTVLDDLYTRLEQGEDVADSINRVTDAINGLAAALNLDTEFNTFVAGLGGTLSDQIDQVVTKLGEVTDNPKLTAKLKAYLADLRQQLAQTYNVDPYAAGYINNGSVPAKPGGADYQTIARARDLGAALAEEVDPAKLQGLMAEITEFLASEVGQTLPEATRKALEDGVRDARGYIDILGSITEDTVIDGWQRASKNIKPPPANEFTDWANKIFGLGREGLASDTAFTALTESLQQARAEGKLTEADLQNLLALIDEFRRPVEIEIGAPRATLSEWQQGLSALTEQFDTGRITAEEYTKGLHEAASQLGDLAMEAEAAGNPALAQQFRDLAASLRAMNPEIAGLLQKFGKLREYAGYVRDVAGAFGQLAGAFGEAEQEYDSLTGEKLQTPWKDLQANLDGAANAIGKVMDIASDVMRIIANPADIGAWVGAITKIVSGIADALAGFQKAKAEAARLRDDFQQANPLLNAGDYQKVSLRSRGFFADLFGGGPQVVNEIDKIGLPIAQSLAGSISKGIGEGFDAYLKTGNMEDFSKALNASLTAGIKDALVQGFLNDPARKNEYADAIKGFTDAWKTHDPAQIQAAAANIYRQTQATTEAARELAAQLDELDRINQTGRYSPEAIAAQQRDLAGRRLNNEETSLEIQHAGSLLSTQEYEDRKLGLTLRRLEQEREAALAAEGLTEEQKALIREEYRLKGQQAQAEHDAAARERAKQQARELATLRLNNEQTALDIQRAGGLITAEDYEQRKLDLTLRRIQAEMEAELAATDLTEEQKAAIREKYDLQAQQARGEFNAAQIKRARDLAALRLGNDQLALDYQHKTGLLKEEEYQRQNLALTLKRLRAEMEAELAATDLTEEQKAAIREKYRLEEQNAQAELDQQRQPMLDGWKSSLKGGISALLTGDNPLDALYSGVRDRIAQGIADGFLSKRILAQLDPLFTQLDSALTAGLDPSGVIRQIGLQLPALSVQMQAQLGPIFQALNLAIPDLTKAVKDNTQAVKEVQYSQTTIVESGPTVRLDDPFRAAFARFT